MLWFRCLSKLYCETPPLNSIGGDKLPFSISTLFCSRGFTSLIRNSVTPTTTTTSLFNSQQLLKPVSVPLGSSSFCSHSTGAGSHKLRGNVLEGRKSVGPPPGSVLPGGVVQTMREYLVSEGRVKWRRRRAKEIEQRKKVLNPSSPVINHRVPLPPDNMDRIPSDLFGYQDFHDPVKEEREKKDIVTEINQQITSKSYGRMFAVINLQGKQFKVTAEDIIIVQGYWAPNVGDRIRLHKILLAGTSDFTLTGRPLLDSNLIRIEGTVVEKTLSYTKLHFILMKRCNYRRLKFFKDPYTMVRINMIEMLEPIKIPQSDQKDRDQTIDVSFRAASANK